MLATWVPLFDAEGDIPLNGKQFDVLFADNDRFTIGDIDGYVMHTPGHTPACATFVIGKAVFVGDTLFNPNLGTARCDFPGGCAEDLYQSIQRIYALPDDYTIYLCHDYPKNGNQPLVSLRISEQKQSNVLLNAHTTEAEYIAKRQARDATLAVPRLLLPSVQTNMRLGDFGPKHANGIQYIKIPINAI